MTDPPNQITSPLTLTPRTGKISGGSAGAEFPAGKFTDEEITQGWFEAIKKFTTNPELALIDNLEDAPLAIRIAVGKAVEFGSRNNHVRQEKIGDLSLTFGDVGGLPPDVLSLISPWCAVRW